MTPDGIVRTKLRPEALLVLSDGTTFEGEAIGATAAISSGEVVFNTVLSGYQEVITDRCIWRLVCGCDMGNDLLDDRQALSAPPRGECRLERFQAV